MVELFPVISNNGMSISNGLKNAWWFYNMWFLVPRLGEHVYLICGVFQFNFIVMVCPESEVMFNAIGLGSN